MQPAHTDRAERAGAQPVWVCMAGVGVHNGSLPVHGWGLCARQVCVHDGSVHVQGRCGCAL